MAEGGSSTATFDDQVSIRRLVLRYVAMAGISLVAVALVTALVARRVGTAAAVDDADRVTRLIAGSAIEPALADGIVVLDPAATTRLDDVVRHQVLGGSLVRVKVWRPDGTIVYSDESRLVGQRFELEPAELDALRSGHSDAGITDLSEPENRYEDSATRLPVPWAFRDDDAGWDDAALWPLLDGFAAAGVVVDVAAIPDALGAGAARELAGRMASGSVRVHQHGRSHANHEPAGRACEFGPARPAAVQAADIAAGRARLAELVGGSLDPVFTPPWNRCTADTAAAVLAAGHEVLSRDVGAGRFDLPGLAEVPVTLDWSGRRRGVALTAIDRGAALARTVAAGGPVGVMLHHAVLDPPARREVHDLLDLVVAAPAARPTTILELARGGSGGAP